MKESNKHVNEQPKTGGLPILKIIVILAILIQTISCGGSKPATQTTASAPSTDVQVAALNRGVKQEKEECEEKALEAGVKNLRDAGNALSENESFSVNMALLDARSKLASQLEILITGMQRRFDEQYAKGQAGSSYSGKGTQLQEGYFEQFLKNTRMICKNTYVKEDGRYNVYVTIEMDEPEQKAMVNQLKKDEILNIDFAEHQFLSEIAKAKEDYRNQKLNQ
ncbi:MAG: hypothetical protein LBB36_04090 [Fibromonadaceae bacterium]|jgi:hypothetical protein|nr:hypothetical protein [Fibromonadaceae bacterium]